MRKTIAVFIAVVAVGLYFEPTSAPAQDESKDAVAAKPAKPKVMQAYRLDFSFYELEGEKKIDTRHYSLNLTSESQDEVKIGTRVPVAVETSGSGNTLTQYQYMDVGTQISAQLRSRGDDEELIVNSEISNLDLPPHSSVAQESDVRVQPPSQGTSTVRIAPVVRQIKINGSTLLVVGKPLLIGSVDDPNSKRQFQLEVTATKLR